MDDLFSYSSISDAFEVLENLIFSTKKQFEKDLSKLTDALKIIDNLSNIYHNEMVRRSDNFNYTRTDRDNQIKMKDLIDRVILMAL